jgi:hypothetical protein
MKTMQLYESPQKEVNEEKYGLLSDQCVCCGKPMKEGKKLYVHMNTDWLAVHPTILEEEVLNITGSESQGFFPIGKACAKKMKDFTI